MTFDIHFFCSEMKRGTSGRVILNLFFTLRECVEKLQVLNHPAERARRLQEVPEVRADPHMSPNYESEEAEEDDRRRGITLSCLNLFHDCSVIFC